MAALRWLKKQKRWPDTNDMQARWCRWAETQLRR
jgi:hypothetical protein